MKTHAIIPVFISHRGCPNDCVFCNQKRITARTGDVTPADARRTIEEHLSTIEKMNLETVELAFFGGSFTGIPLEEQRAFLALAREYKDAGKIHKIHLSTRPDYINEEILDNLKHYGADVIELGVQSFDEEVLRLSGRGHDAAVVYESSALIKEYGFTLGIQLMAGLPGDSLEKCIFSARETVRIAPEIARIYPTVVIRDTSLHDMMLAGTYTPLSEEEAINRSKAMYEILDAAGINIIRVGLKSSDIMASETAFHPAFRQLVEGRIARERLEAGLTAQLKARLTAQPAGGAGGAPGAASVFGSGAAAELRVATGLEAPGAGGAVDLGSAGFATCATSLGAPPVFGSGAAAELRVATGLGSAAGLTAGTAELRVVAALEAPGSGTPGAPAPAEALFFSNEKCYNNMFGHKACNRKYFEEAYPQLHFHFAVDPELKNNEYKVKLSGGHAADAPDSSGTPASLGTPDSSDTPATPGAPRRHPHPCIKQKGEIK